MYWFKALILIIVSSILLPMYGASESIYLNESHYDIIYKYLAQANDEVELPGILDRTRSNEPIQKVVTDVLWDMVFKDAHWYSWHKTKAIVRFAYNKLALDGFNLSDRIRFDIISRRYKLGLVDHEKLFDEIAKLIEDRTIKTRTIYILLMHQRRLVERFRLLIDLIKWHYPMEVEKFNHVKSGKEIISKEALRELFHYNPRTDIFASGKYNEGVRLYLFCRSNRNYPCLFLMKNADNTLRMFGDGVTPWNLKALALSRGNKLFHQKDGNTPQGIYTMDSVMPHTDHYIKYGRYRRIKLNFLDKVSSESNYKYLLSKKALDEKWWMETVLARDAGRELLRIHGTGLRNWKFFSRHRTFVATRGCITTREGRYFSRGRLKKFRDQRRLLDEMLISMNLNPSAIGEQGIKGILYVININDKRKAVTLSELRQLLDI